MHGVAQKMEAGVPSPDSSPIWALWRTSRHRRKDDTRHRTGCHYYQYSYWRTETTAHYDVIKQIHFLVIGGWRLLSTCLPLVPLRHSGRQVKTVTTQVFGHISFSRPRRDLLDECLPTSVTCHTTEKVLPSLADWPLLEDTALSSLLTLNQEFPTKWRSQEKKLKRSHTT